MIGPLADFREKSIAHFLGQPHGLERAVAFDGTRRVVVNAFAGTREQARSRVVLVHDQIGIGLIAHERDADDHLADGGAGQRVSAAQCLRAEQHVNAKGAALPDNAVEQNGSALRDTVFLRKIFLEFVNQQQ